MELLKRLISKQADAPLSPAPRAPPTPRTCTLQILYMTCCQHTRTDPQRAHDTCRGQQPFSAPLMSHRCLAATRGYWGPGGRGGDKTSGQWLGFFKCSVSQNSNKSRVIQRTISGLSYFSKSATVNPQAAVVFKHSNQSVSLCFKDTTRG